MYNEYPDSNSISIYKIIESCIPQVNIEAFSKLDINTLFDAIGKTVQSITLSSRNKEIDIATEKLVEAILAIIDLSRREKYEIARFKYHFERDIEIPDWKYIVLEIKLGEDLDFEAKYRFWSKASKLVARILGGENADKVVVVVE